MASTPVRGTLIKLNLLILRRAKARSREAQCLAQGPSKRQQGRTELRTPAPASERSPSNSQAGGEKGRRIRGNEDNLESGSGTRGGRLEYVTQGLRLWVILLGLSWSHSWVRTLRDPLLFPQRPTGCAGCLWPKIKPRGKSRGGQVRMSRTRTLSFLSLSHAQCASFCLPACCCMITE